MKREVQEYFRGCLDSNALDYIDFKGNEVPEPFIFSDNYTQLYPPNEGWCEMKPRLGAFEISTVIYGNVEDEREDGTKVLIPQKVDILFYSKLMSGTWPNYEALGERMAEFFSKLNADATNAADLKSEYQFKGVVRKAGRNASPTKTR